MAAEPMRRWIAGAVLGLLLAAGTRLNAEGENRDPKAVEVARTMMRAMGGEDAWNAVHFVRFDFKINAGKLKWDNAHLWDRKDGRYRIERTGKHEVDLFTIADYERDKSGSVYVNGKKLEGDEARKLLV